MYHTIKTADLRHSNSLLSCPFAPRIIM